MIWYRIESQSYMDFYPEISYRSFVDDQTAKAFEEHMNNSAWSGTCRVSLANPKELLQFAKENCTDPEVLQEITLYCTKYA